MHDHVTQMKIDFNWLPIKERIIFKVPLTIYKTLNDQGFGHLRDMLAWYEHPLALRLASSM